MISKFKALALVIVLLTAMRAPLAASPPYPTPPRPALPPTQIPLATPTPVPTPTPTPTPEPSAPSWYHPRVEATVTLEKVTLQADVRCGTGYNVYLAYATNWDACKWWPPHSKQVLTKTQLVKPISFTWADYMKPPQPGDETCIWWDCKSIDSYGAALHFNIIRKPILARYYFPFMGKGNADGGN